MPLPPLSQLSLLVLFSILGAAVVSDLREHRIPNALTFGGLAAALILQAAWAGSDGLLVALGGISIAMLLFFPFYMVGGMGGGDVKLMLVVGAFLGPMTALLACAVTLLAGALLGLTVAAWRGVLTSLAKRYGSMLRTLMLTGRTFYEPPSDDDVLVSRPFPYALAIASGTCAALLWAGQLGGSATALVGLR